MSDLKALDKLRSLENLDSIDALLLLAAIQEIEREISERYIRLPCDADGVPIRVGDAIAEKPFRPNTGEKPAEVVCMLLNSDGWAIGDCDPRGHWHGPLQLEHVKPDPLKELLEELVSEARQDSRDFSVEPWCDAVRELMGGDAS